ncbi:hypothetical protein CHS0354_005990 [Potamilus streckersoni]|uniref:Uncharacterized protein n=1 Tax=Potamilus streckersoni TaxID=2493646 RepID=A0AAE0RNU9_9BIVA|nr:hypothetical protein CHS0354_005990 [Potamilus streckersoni]
MYKYAVCKGAHIVLKEGSTILRSSEEDIKPGPLPTKAKGSEYISTSSLQTTTPNSPDDGGPNIGVIVAGVLVPLIVIGIGLLVLYIWYRKKYPVRMVFGKDFGKFTNPLYDKRPSTLSLVREDAYKFWEGNEAGLDGPEAGLDGPASETDDDKEAKIFMEASGQNRFKSQSGISLVVEDWRAVESDGSLGINTEEISQSNKQRKLSHDVNDETALDQSDTGNVKAKKRIHVDKSVLEGLRRQDSTETKEVKKVDIVTVESTENNIVFQQSGDIKQTFSEVVEKSTNPIHFDETVSLESTANIIGSQQSTDIMENDAEASEKNVISLKPFEEKSLGSEKDENDIIEEKETHDSDQYVEFGTYRNDDSVMVVNIQEITNEPTGSMKIPNHLKMHANELSGLMNTSTNMEVERQTDPSNNLLREHIDVDETMESTQTNKEHIFDKASHPVERQLDVSVTESSVHLSRRQRFQDKQTLLQIPESEQCSDHNEEQFHKQLYKKDLSWASAEDIHQLRTPKDELALTDLSIEIEEDIDVPTAEVREQNVRNLITADTDEEIDSDTAENKEALSTPSIQTEAYSENRVKDINIVHETQQCSYIYEQMNPNIQDFGEFSSGECTLENICSQKAEFSPQDANTDQEDKVRADTKAFSTSESGSSDSSIDDTSYEKKETPSLDVKFLINSSDVQKVESSATLSFEKIENVNINPNVSERKFAEEQFEKIDSVVLETDSLDKDVERISSNQSIDTGFNVECSIPATVGYDLDTIMSSNLNKNSAKSSKPVTNADPNSSEISLSNNLKKIKVSFKDFDFSSSDSDDESSDDSGDKPMDNTHNEHYLNDSTRTNSDSMLDKDDHFSDMDSAQCQTQGLDHISALGAEQYSKGLHIEAYCDVSGGSHLTTTMAPSMNAKFSGKSSEDDDSVITIDNDDTELEV